MKNKILLLVITAFVLAGGFFAALKFYKNKTTEEISAVAQMDQKKLVPDYAPKIGTSTPKAFLVEFLDPECESCREFYPVVKMLLQEYEGQIQLVVRYAPFHPNSRTAIKILEASRKQGKYWETLETLFRYQPQWGSHHDPRPELMWKYLPEAGVDVEKIRQDMNDPEIEKNLEQDVIDGRDLMVRATPSFFVNGRPLEVFSLDALKELIQSELQKAN